MLLLETGISRSELLGLRWEDIDEEGRSIHINQGLVVYHSAEENKQVMESNGLKNKFRKRTIPITDDALWKRLLQAPRTVTVAKRLS
jgi:integrase